MKYKLTIKTKELLADLQTPVSIYLKIRDIYPESVLLESSDFHGGEDSSSFIAFNPIAKFKVEGEKITTEINGKSQSRELKDKLPVEFDNFIKSFKVQGENPTKINGFFGYSSYDSIHYFEEIDTANKKLKNADIPEFYYIFYRFILVINHLKNELIIVENILEGETSEMEELEALLQNNNFASYNFNLAGKKFH